MNRPATLGAVRDERVVLVYRDDLGRPSERFVWEPLRHLQSHRAVLVATRKPRSFAPPLAARLVTPRLPLPQKARVATYRLAGPGRRAVADLASLEPRLLHAHFGIDAVQALPLSRRLGVPLVTTFHGYDVLSDEQDLARSHRGRSYLRRRDELAHHGALFLAVSDYLRQQLVERGFPSERTVTLTTGVDLDRFHPTSAAGEGVLFVGRLVRSKGVHLLIDAVAALPEPLRPTVTVIGDGPERRGLEEQCRSVGLPVRFLGSVEHATVVRELDRTAVLCTPTTSEALCLANIEAQAMRVPVVSFRVGGVAEAVLDGRTGLLAEPGDVDGLRGHLSRLLTDEGLRAQMGEAGQENVRTRFDQRKQIAKLETLYEQVAP